MPKFFGNVFFGECQAIKMEYINKSVEEHFKDKIN
jgi:hypothetical protein